MVAAYTYGVVSVQSIICEASRADGDYSRKSQHQYEECVDGLGKHVDHATLCWPRDSFSLRLDG